MAPGERAVVVVQVANGTQQPHTAALYPLRAAAVLPAPVLVGRTITLELDGPRQVCLVVDGRTDAPLCIFADPPETYLPSPGDPGVIYFGPGTVNAGVIDVPAGGTVYLAPGAHVFGRVQFSGSSAACTAAAAGVAVRGRGVLDGHAFPINGTGPSLVSLPCAHALLEGITMLNSPQYHLQVSDWPRTTVQWAKAIAWGYSTDGITGGAQSLFRNSFLKVNDDALKPYGTGTLATDIVLWQMENGCAVMGSWNLNADVGFVTARALDVIRHERSYGDYDPSGLLCFMHGGSADLMNYLFDDVRVDMPGWAAVQLLVLNNSWAHPVGGVPGSLAAAIVIRNFSSAAPFLHAPPVRLQGYGPASTVTGVTLDSVRFDGREASPADVAITGNAAFAHAPALCDDGCTRSIVADDCAEVQPAEF